MYSAEDKNLQYPGYPKYNEHGLILQEIGTLTQDLGKPVVIGACVIGSLQTV